MRKDYRLWQVLLVVALAAVAGCSGGGSPLEPASPSEAPFPAPNPAAPNPAPAPTGDLSSGEYAFVLNRVSNDVSVLAAAEGYTEVRRIPLPHVGATRPTSLAVDAASRTIFVGFPDSSTTVVALGFDGAERGRTTVLGWSPDLALDAARGLLAVATGSGLEFLDAGTLASRARVATGTGRRGAWHVALDSAAGVAAVSHSLLDEVALVSTADFRLLERVPVHAFPDEVEVLDGVLYVAATDADMVDAFSIGERRMLFSTSTGNGPVAIKASRRLNRIFVADDLSGQVTVVETGTGSSAAQWSLGHSIPDLALNGAESLLFVCSPVDDVVEILDTATGARVGSAQVGNLPTLIRVVELT